MVVQLRAVFRIFRSSVRHFPERSWTVVAFPCFTVVKSFTSLYALLLLFFLRFSSILLNCSTIQFSVAFFTHLLILLFTSLVGQDIINTVKRHSSPDAPMTSLIKTKMAQEVHAHLARRKKYKRSRLCTSDNANRHSQN